MNLLVQLDSQTSIEMINLFKEMKNRKGNDHRYRNP
jgi:hypothetical protein